GLPPAVRRAAGRARARGVRGGQHAGRAGGRAPQARARAAGGGHRPGRAGARLPRRRAPPGLPGRARGVPGQDRARGRGLRPGVDLPGDRRPARRPQRPRRLALARVEDPGRARRGPARVRRAAGPVHRGQARDDRGLPHLEPADRARPGGRPHPPSVRRDALAAAQHDVLHRQPAGLEHRREHRDRARGRRVLAVAARGARHPDLRLHAQLLPRHLPREARVRAPGHRLRGPAARMRPTDLRGILRYVPQFREKTFVVAVDGAVVGDDNFGNLLMDVAVLWSLNIRTVLVHGAAAQIQALAEGGGAEPSDLEGSGGTDPDTPQLALTASNRVTHRILEALSTADLQGASSNAVIAHPLGILRGVDHLFTGRVERVDRELLQTLLGNGVVPVVPPLGMDGNGRSYRLNSDAVALDVARALSAVKLVFITTTDGLVVNGTVARPLSVD